MTNKDVDFETWFDLLQMNLESEGINFSDKDSVRDDYDAGKSMFDVMDDIKREW